MWLLSVLLGNGFIEGKELQSFIRELREARQQAGLVSSDTPVHLLTCTIFVSSDVQFLSFLSLWVLDRSQINPLFITVTMTTSRCIVPVSDVNLQVKKSELISQQNLIIFVPVFTVCDLYLFINLLINRESC